ncbi:hypothetical protein SISSUDRAFT_1045668 [Sistotremastrum suecicum HHB10207 ss-3]|uniref:EF-hand domain-containing protein n=1 Tax=Sistotremastrum suecicum HHB10207 ss-3 TaxID=1314776 RepID=A0A166EAA4_9AGAM|nr:hypothetical protein SISSUDRAFT_1045668 [Sistotremastrum suecicum HHB10207 ss-3]
MASTPPRPRVRPVSIDLSNNNDRGRSPRSQNDATSTLHDDEHQASRQTSLDTDTVTNSSDEFDWEAEDEVAPTDLIADKKARRGRKIYQAFMRLARPLRIITIALLGAGILITPYLVFKFQFSNLTNVRPHVRAWSLWLTISWALACFTSLIVHVIPRILIRVVVAVYGKPHQNLVMQVELFMAVTGWLKLCLDISWMWITLSVLRAVLNPPGKYWTIVNRVMQALFSASIILLVEKIFLQFVAIRFHKKALSDRLTENRLALKALDRLSNAQPSSAKKTGMHGRSRTALNGAKDSPASSRGNSIDLLRVANNPDLTKDQLIKEAEKPVPTRHKQRQERRKKKNLMAGIIVDQVGGAIGQIALKDSKLNKQGDVGSLWSARRLARKLFEGLAASGDDRSYLIVDDFYPYFPTTAEAETAFAIFDKDNNGDISKREMREAVQRIYRERKALTASLKDVGSAVAKLDAVLVFIALLATAFISLLIFNRSDTIQSLVPLATIVLGFSFIFGHSAQLLFESLIFIFSTHVFDVGDLVMIDDQILLVKEFGLFSTTFRRVDGTEVIAPNTLLASSKLIHNLRRSNSMWETTNLTVAYDTPLEAIEQLKSRLQSYVASNNREWSGVGVNIDKMEFQNSIQLIIAMEHKANWQDWGGRWARRTAFMRNLKTVLEELEIGYSLPLQPVYVQGSSSATARAAVELAESLGNAASLSSGDMHRAPAPSIQVSSI